MHPPSTRNIENGKNQTYSFMHGCYRTDLILSGTAVKSGVNVNNVLSGVDTGGIESPSGGNSANTLLRAWGMKSHKS